MTKSAWPLVRRSSSARLPRCLFPTLTYGRAHHGLTLVGLEVDNQPGRSGRYLELVRKFRYELADRRHEWAARQADLALFQFGQEERWTTTAGPPAGASFPSVFPMPTRTYGIPAKSMALRREDLPVELTGPSANQPIRDCCSSAETGHRTTTGHDNGP